MKKIFSKTFIIATATVIAVCFAFVFTPLPAEAAQPLSAPAFPHVARQSDTSLALEWSKVSGASGYQIYRYSSASKKYKLAGTVRSGKKLRWKDSGLKTGKKYIYKIRAYKREGFGKKVSAFTYSVSAVPYKRNSATVNASSKFGGGNTLKLGIKQKLKPDVKALPSVYGTAKKKKVVDDSVRILPIASKLLSVSKNTLTGKSEGVVSVYVIAHNGNAKKIKVTVVDYAKPKYWINLDRTESISKLISDQGANITAVFSYLAIMNNAQDEESDLYLDNNGELVNNSNLKIDGMENRIKELLNGCYYYYNNTHMTAIISYIGSIISIEMRGSVYDGTYLKCYIIYNIQNDYPEEEYNDMMFTGLKIADHWIAVSEVFVNDNL